MNPKHHLDPAEAWRDAKAPIRHRNTDPKADAQWSKLCYLIVDEFKENDDMMVAMCGERGTGKTMAATVLMRDACSRGYSCLYTLTMDFFMAVKETFNNEESTKRVLDRFITPHLLVLDETQVRSESKWENDLLTYMVDKRYQACKATVFITNVEKAKLREHLGDSIVSRIHECGGATEGVVVFTGGSFRLKRGQE